VDDFLSSETRSAHQDTFIPPKLDSTHSRPIVPRCVAFDYFSVGEAKTPLDMNLIGCAKLVFLSVRCDTHTIFWTISEKRLAC